MSTPRSANSELVHGLRRLQGGAASGGGQPCQRAPAVIGIGSPCHETSSLQAVDGIGHARWVHLQTLSDLPERQRALPGKREEHEDLVASEGEVVGPQGCVGAGQKDLLQAHDRGHQSDRRSLVGHPWTSHWRRASAIGSNDSRWLSTTGAPRSRREVTGSLDGRDEAIAAAVERREFPSPYWRTQTQIEWARDHSTTNRPFLGEQGVFWPLLALPGPQAGKRPPATRRPRQKRNIQKPERHSPCFNT